MSFPSDEHEAAYQYNLKGVMNMLRSKHAENILILNFSEPRTDLQRENNQVSMTRPPPYQYNLKGVMNMLRSKHAENILILNFSEPRTDLQRENNQVCMTPPLPV